MRTLILCVALTAAAPAYAQTFNSGGVAAGTNVTAGAASDPHSNSATAVSAPASIAASATSTVSNPTTEATTFVNVGATWASAAAGTVSIDWGWSGTAGTGSLQTNTVPNNWTYNFTTGAAASQFVGSWVFNVAGTSSAFGIQGLYGSGGLPFNITPGTSSPVSGTGSFVVNLLPNTAYSFGVFNYGNLNGSLTQNANAAFDLDWRISPLGGVPEPTTWALMILGFGVIGGALRRRHPATVQMTLRAA